MASNGGQPVTDRGTVDLHNTESDGERCSKAIRDALPQVTTVIHKRTLLRLRILP